MATCKEWTKKGSLEKFWNDAHQEDEEREKTRNSWMQEVTIEMREQGIGDLEWVDRRVEKEN